VYRFTDRLADATIAVCETAAVRHRAAHAVSAKRVRVIPNGVDTAQFHPYAAHRATVRNELGLGNRFTWLAVGRLMWKKDFPTLLEAFALVADATLLIAGDGEQREKLERTAEDLHIDARFLGSRPDIGNLMNGCDAFVMSSVIEGLPVVLLEAASIGLPCVATNVGGVPEVIVDGRTGFIVSPGEPLQLGEAMSALMKLSPAERARMGSAARKRAVTKFDWNVVVPRWESLYRELLGAARIAAREPEP
jgi:glycosyltransferase involved in cell wall biosynthesis